VLSFAEGTGWLAQIGLFVLLGLYASPGALGGALLPALVSGLVLVLLARPVSVAVSMLPFRPPWREQAFLSWAGLRGAVPIVLAMIPLTRAPESAQARLLVDVVFVLVVLLTLLQGTTLPWVARVLRVSRAGEATEIEVDSAPLDELDADLLQDAGFVVATHHRYFPRLRLELEQGLGWKADVEAALERLLESAQLQQPVGAGASPCL